MDCFMPLLFIDKSLFLWNLVNPPEDRGCGMPDPHPSFCRAFYFPGKPEQRTRTRGEVIGRYE